MMKSNEVIKKFFSGWKWVLIIPIIFLASADAFSMAAPYYIRNIFPNVNNFLGITPSQLSMLMGVLGFSTLLSQLPGGWLADKCSSKKMLIMSLFMTGFLTMLWAMTPYITDMSIKMTILGLTYIGWGISTTLIFWTPLWKLLSQQGEKDDQGKIYGLQGSINGLIGFGLIFLIGIILTTVGIFQFELNGVPIGFTIFAFYMGFMLFGTAFGVSVFVKEKHTSEKFSMNMSVMGKVLSNYKIWLLGFFVMGIYIIQTSLTFMTNYMANILLLGAVFVSFIGAFRTYLARMIISSPAGKFCDKRRSYIEVLLYTLAAAIVLLLLTAILPGFKNEISSDKYRIFLQIVTVSSVLMMGFLCWIMVTTRFTAIVEIDTPPNSHATVVGVISLIAFSTDSWFYPIAGVVQDNHVIINDAGETFTDQAGLQIIFLIISLISLFGFFCGLVLFLINRWEFKHKGIPFKKELNNEANNTLDNTDNTDNKVKQKIKLETLTIKLNTKDNNYIKNQHNINIDNHVGIMQKRIRLVYE